MAYDNTFQAKVFPTLFEVFEDLFSPMFDGRVYAQVATPLHEYPCLVYQSQDLGGLNADKINMNGWEGAITFRVIDVTLSGAWNKAAELTSVFQNAVHSGVDIRIKANKPLMFPVERRSEGNVYTAGIITEVDMYPKDTV